MSNYSRRHLFRQATQAGKRIIGLCDDGEPVREPAGGGLRAGIDAIAGDFPPEMLALEAERLGLDPESTGRDALLESLYQAMAAAGETKSGP